MDIYTKIQDLIDDMKGDWKKLFLSETMDSFLRHYAENLFSGVFTSLQLQGAQIAPSLVETEMKQMKIERIYDLNHEIQTACCISEPSKFTIVINGCGKIVNAVDSVEEKFEVVTGLLVHEVGHRLFTDFPTANAQALQMEQYGRWFPIPPTNIGTVEGINLRNMLMQNLDFRKTFAELLMKLDNCLEDAYEENELRSHYPGLASCYLATASKIRHNNAPSMTESINVLNAKLFEVLLSQWFQYALYGELNVGEKDISEFDATLVSAIYDGMNIIDDCVNERDPLKRASLKNQLAVMVYPFIEQDLQTKSPNSKQPGGNQQANQAVQKAILRAANSAAGGMVSKNSNGASSSSSITNINKANNTHLCPTVVIGGGGKDGLGNGGNRSYEEPDHSIGTHDLNKMLTDNAEQLIHHELEKERAQSMQHEANDIFKDTPMKAPEIIRLTDVSEEQKEQYDKAKGRTIAIAHRLAQMLNKQLMDTHEILKWRYNGNQFSSKQYCRDTLKCFTKKSVTTEKLGCRVYVLVDESGSVTNDLSDAEVITSMCLEQFCSEVKIPLTIQGYTTGGSSGVCIYSYVEEKRIDGQDKYRIMGMSSRQGTPTVAAMTYALGRMSKVNSGEHQLLFVITDGGAGDDDWVGSKTKKLIRMAKKQNITVLGCGIGNDKSDIEAEFGEDHFLGIDDLDSMPKRLMDIIRRQIVQK